MVFFDYDVAAVRTDARTTLDAKAQILRGDPSITLRVAGHADERGSTEYNLALGNRRAMAIKEYITGFGIAGDRLQVTSYGEERPLAQGSGESVWSRNRRGEFTITGGLSAAR
jgi:peptidoglycan-associated lipoprotein